MVASNPNGLSGQRDVAEPSRIEGPLCPWCGYLLVGLEDDRCPECGTVGAVSAAERGAPLVAMRKAKRACIVGMLAAAAVSGLVDAFQPSKNFGGVLILGAVYIGTLGWWASDVRQRQARYSTFVKVLMILVPPLGLCWYFASQRRFNSVAYGIINSVAYGMAVSAGILFSYAAVFGVVHRLMWGRWPA